MQENTNKAIVVNSIINYSKMIINTILALLTTRFALQSLGITDFGLYSVLGGIISFINLFNVIMVSTCNRFLGIAIGKGDLQEINRAFNVNRTLFTIGALFLLILSYPVGTWYIHNYVNYDGPIENALMVFGFSVMGSILSVLANPYNGLLITKERFLVFSLTDIISHIVRFIVAWMLVYHISSNKLMIYSVTMATMTALPLIVYPLYCRSLFPDIVRWTLVKDKEYYKSVAKFSGWVSYGAVAWMVRNQGAALLVNAFFSTVANTALGIANSLNSYVSLFANNLTQPIQPQITKSYAVGNNQRTDELLIMSTKFSFMMMLLIGAPFFVSAEWILQLWLGEVPPYAVYFTILLIIDNLVISFNSGLSVMLFASGKIALYQIVVNTLRLFAIVVAYFVLKSGAEPYALFYTYIAFSIIIVIATQWCLHKSLNYNNKPLIVHSYLPSCSILICFLLVLFIPNSIHPFFRIVIAEVYLVLLELLLGLSKNERQYVFYIINRLRK